MDSIDQQAHLEKEKEDQKQEEHDESQIHSKEDPTQGTEDEEKYPPFKVVLPVVLSLYLAIFLISLVSIYGTILWLLPSYSHRLGPHDHRCCDTGHFQRVQQLWRHLVVRGRVSADLGCHPIAYGQSVCESCRNQNTETRTEG